ncbi:Hypothetical protein Trvi_ORF143 [Trabala vishnou gigantina nucleopolyhedrovirus]|uniref:Hypothetical protein n=1 Tax=Trabala vishnou gigantina nucleopolyhedrovirus TaxID=2863583 RepID=UPI002481ACBF|nr:Hypothetical protein QKU87_gp143 [Trabala vishnou gigantina nucleopolyhedrovirus]QYC92752.1 Hypothetical protein Trvi_ORF143 [Trabala vishnou gigantina nucleopolyhedrovirus]
MSMKTAVTYYLMMTSFLSTHCFFKPIESVSLNNLYNYTITNIDNNKKNTNNNNNEDANHDIDTLFGMIMEEVNKIHKNEVTDYSYTRMIFIILILFFIFSFKTKLYKILTCFTRKKKNANNNDNDDDNEDNKHVLEKITIREFNYNINN